MKHKIYKYDTVLDKVKGAYIINWLYDLGVLFDSDILRDKAAKMGDALIIKYIKQPYGTCSFTSKGIVTWNWKES